MTTRDSGIPVVGTALPSWQWPSCVSPLPAPRQVDHVFVWGEVPALGGRVQVRFSAKGAC